MNTNILNSITNGMNQQIDMLNKLNDLMDDCEDRMIFGEVKETDIQHLRKYCADMMLATETAKDLVKALEPIYKEESKPKAEEEKKPSPKKKAPNKKASEKKKKSEELKEPEKVEEAKIEETEDAEEDFLD